MLHKVIALLSLGVFLFLVYVQAHFPQGSWLDQWMLEVLVPLAGTTQSMWHSVAQTISNSMYVVVAIAAAMWVISLAKKWSEHGIQTNLTILMMLIVLTEPFKAIFQRPRILEHMVSYSFPSTHTLAAGISMVAFIYVAKAKNIPSRLFKIITIIGIAYVLLVGWSRIMLQAHHPTDALASLVLTVIIYCVLRIIHDKNFQHQAKS